jgi:hypothetical protein
MLVRQTWLRPCRPLAALAKPNCGVVWLVTHCPTIYWFPRHHQNAGRRVSCMGHTRLTSGFAFGPRSEIGVSWDNLSGPAQPLP